MKHKHKARAQIMAYMMFKDGLIFKKTGQRFIWMNDLLDVTKWTRKECKFVWKALVAEHNTDFDQCPWCIVSELRREDPADNLCTDCNYGKNHGVCSKPDSGYRRVRAALSDFDTLEYSGSLSNRLPEITDYLEGRI